MKSNLLWIIIAISCSFMISSVDANHSDITSPGPSVNSEITLHRFITAEFSSTEHKRTSVQQLINKVVKSEANQLTPQSIFLSNVQQRAIFASPKASAFLLSNWSYSNSINDVVKKSIELYPEASESIIKLALSLSPDDATTTLHIVAMTGQIDQDALLIYALEAGLDPSSVSSATAAGNSNIMPLPVTLSATVNQTTN